MSLTVPLKFTSRSWAIELDPATGALSGLSFLAAAGAAKPGYTGRKAAPGLVQGRTHPPSWASPESLLAKLVYSTYSEDSYDVIWREYAYQTDLPEWFYKDFGKPNATELGGAQRRDDPARLHAVWTRQEDGQGTSSGVAGDSGGFHVVAELRFDPDLRKYAGAPKKAYLEYQSSRDSTDLLVDVVIEGKAPTRLPEATWLSWQPAVAAVDSESWTMSKLGQSVSPLEVIRNGSMSMHAVDDNGVSVRSVDGTQQLSVRSLDAALVSPGNPTPFPNVRHLPELEKGVSFCLHNNVWGTNYVMWWPYQEQDDAMRWRFIVQMEGGEGGARQDS